MLSQPVIKRVVLSRYLFDLALHNVRAQQETGDAACVNLLQDAVEIFFIAALDHLNVGLKPRTEFPQYLDKLSEALDCDLPYRRRLLELNRVRVASKHDGITPNRKEMDGYVSDTRKFLEELCRRVLGADFWTISLIDLLDDDETKTLLQAAEAAHAKGEFAQCLADCRKAFYVAFEADYDTQRDLEDDTSLFGSRAPYYARAKDYIKKNVKDHFGYVVLDHAQVDRDLTSEGVDHTAFWNVWRLTPQVYRHKKEDRWRVKHQPNLHNEEGFKERSALVLSTMVAILLARQNTKRAALYADGTGYQDIRAKDGAKFYERADKNGAVAGVLPEGKNKVSVNYAAQGLNDDDWYWSAMYMEKVDENLVWIVGYILEDELIFGD